MYTTFEIYWVISIPDYGKKKHTFFSQFLASRGPKIGPMWSKSESILNTNLTSVYTKSEMDWLISFPDNGQKSLISVIFGPLEGLNWANIAQKANQFWTLAQQVYTSSWEWIELLVFQIMVRNHHFQSFFGH